MPISDQIARELPYLRLYARVLTGSQSFGDGLVRELLEAAIVDPDLREKLSGSRIDLYAAFSGIYASAAAAVPPVEEANGALETAAKRLGRVTPLARQALLLNAVVNFSTDDVAAILGCTEAEAGSMIDEALNEIEADVSTEVLIIEDEPLIAFQLEQLVEMMGNKVIGIAATHDEAVHLFETHRPALVLADIQLADGSSGIDAVNEILAEHDVPVIFITAFPERLLTGERPEPTYLITKPFSDDFVRATIGQVTFFGSTAPVL